eukprot:TRINITY_DN684_c2_g1_i1.p1 TRINITY_DN684_c2_g1~~TRINITY_DN684_c2_g1_i1.p1  ORF type:complete len:2547 (-),score=489.68 TRINITY_DN684_c2_g1_i1:186-7448(-)
MVEYFRLHERLQPIENFLSNIFPYLLYFTGFPWAEISPSFSKPCADSEDEEAGFSNGQATKNVPTIAALTQISKDTGISPEVLRGIDISQWSISPLSRSNNTCLTRESVIGLLLPIFDKARVRVPNLPSAGLVKAMVSLAHCKTENLEHLAEALGLNTFLVQVLVHLVDISRNRTSRRKVTEIQQKIQTSSGVGKQLVRLGLRPQQFLALLELTFPNINDFAEVPSLAEKAGLLSLGIDTSVVELLYVLVNGALMHLQGVADVTGYQRINTRLNTALEPVASRMNFSQTLVPLITARLFLGDFHIVGSKDDMMQSLMPYSTERNIAMAVCGLLSFEAPQFSYVPVVLDGVVSLETWKSKDEIPRTDADAEEEDYEYFFFPTSEEEQHGTGEGWSFEVTTDTLLPTDPMFFFRAYVDGIWSDLEFEAEVLGHQKFVVVVKGRPLESRNDKIDLYWVAWPKHCDTAEKLREEQKIAACQGLREIERVCLAASRRLHWGGQAWVWWSELEVHPLFILLADGDVHAVRLAADLLGVSSVALAHILGFSAVAPAEVLPPLLLADLCAHTRSGKAHKHTLAYNLCNEAIPAPPGILVGNEAKKTVIDWSPLKTLPKRTRIIPAEADAMPKTVGSVSSTLDARKHAEFFDDASLNLSRRFKTFGATAALFARTTKKEADPAKRAEVTEEELDELETEEDSDISNMSELDEEAEERSEGTEAGNDVRSDDEEDTSSEDSEVNAATNSKDTEEAKFAEWVSQRELDQFPDILSNTIVSHGRLSLFVVPTDFKSRHPQVWCKTICDQRGFEAASMDSLMALHKDNGQEYCLALPPVLDEAGSRWKELPDNMHLRLTAMLVQLNVYLDPEAEEDSACNSVDKAPSVSLMAGLAKLHQARRACATKNDEPSRRKIRQTLMPGLWGLEAHFRRNNYRQRLALSKEIKDDTTSSWAGGGIRGFKVPDALIQNSMTGEFPKTDLTLDWDWDNWKWPQDVVTDMYCRIAQVARLSLGACQPVECYHPCDGDDLLSFATTDLEPLVNNKILRGWKIEEDEQKAVFMGQRELIKDLTNVDGMATVMALAACGADPIDGAYSIKRIKTAKEIEELSSVYSSVASMLSTSFGHHVQWRPSSSTKADSGNVETSTTPPETLCCMGEAFKKLLPPEEQACFQVTQWAQALCTDIGLNPLIAEALVTTAHGFVKDEDSLKGRSCEKAFDALTQRLRLHPDRPEAGRKLLVSICTKGWSLHSAKVLADTLRIRGEVVRGVINASLGQVSGWVELQRVLFPDGAVGSSSAGASSRNAGKESLDSTNDAVEQRSTKFLEKLGKFGNKVKVSTKDAATKAGISLLQSNERSPQEVRREMQERMLEACEAFAKLEKKCKAKAHGSQQNSKSGFKDQTQAMKTVVKRLVRLLLPELRGDGSRASLAPALEKARSVSRISGPRPSVRSSSGTPGDPVEPILVATCTMLLHLLSGQNCAAAYRVRNFKVYLPSRGPYAIGLMAADVLGHRVDPRLPRRLDREITPVSGPTSPSTPGGSTINEGSSDGGKGWAKVRETIDNNHRHVLSEALGLNERGSLCLWNFSIFVRQTSEKPSAKDFTNMQDLVDPLYEFVSGQAEDGTCAIPIDDGVSGEIISKTDVKGMKERLRNLLKCIYSMVYQRNAEVLKTMTTIMSMNIHDLMSRKGDLFFQSNKEPRWIANEPLDSVVRDALLDEPGLRAVVCVQSLLTFIQLRNSQTSRKSAGAITAGGGTGILSLGPLVSSLYRNDRVTQRKETCRKMLTSNKSKPLSQDTSLEFARYGEPLPEGPSSSMTPPPPPMLGLYRETTALPAAAAANHPRSSCEAAAPLTPPPPLVEELNNNRGQAQGRRRSRSGHAKIKDHDQKAINAMSHFFVGFAANCRAKMTKLGEKDGLRDAIEDFEKVVPIMAAAATGRLDTLIYKLRELAYEPCEEARNDEDNKQERLALDFDLMLDILAFLGLNEGIYKEHVDINGQHGDFMPVLVSRIFEHCGVCKEHMKDLVKQLLTLLIGLCVEASPVLLQKQITALCKPLREHIEDEVRGVGNEGTKAAIRTIIEASTSIATSVSAGKSVENMRLFEWRGQEEPLAPAILNAVFDLVFPFMAKEMREPLQAVLWILADFAQLAADPNIANVMRRQKQIAEHLSKALSMPKHIFSGIFAVVQGDWLGAVELCRGFGNINPELLVSLGRLLPLVRKAVAPPKESEMRWDEVEAIERSNANLLVRSQQIAADAMQNKANTNELFELTDVDRNGTISVEELMMLTKRMGYNLTPHRLDEVLSKCKTSLTKKSEQHMRTKDLEGLNQEEFKAALDYLNRQITSSTLNFLGNSWSNLMFYLLFVSLILILIIIFIFLGINAFSSGGVFSAVVNSIMTISAGLVVSRKKIGQAMEDGVSSERVQALVDQVSETVMQAF